MFVTVFYGIYDLNTGDITYCNAGHNPPYILKSNGQVEELPMSEDMMVGVFEDFTYTNATIHLDKGDTLLMFTDGVNEAMNIDFEQFGDDRLKQTLTMQAGNGCQKLIDSIKSNVSSFVGKAEQSDDITMLAIKRL